MSIPKKNKNAGTTTEVPAFNLLVHILAQIVIRNPFLNDILHQQGNAPLFTYCNFRQNLLGFFICAEGNILCLFHSDHPYTSYTFFVDKSMFTL